MSFPAYDPSPWTALFTATASTSATLTGLVFVAVSINIRAILKGPGLPERALEPLILLLGVLAVSILALIPRQGPTVLGIELATESVLRTTAVALLINDGRKRPQMRRSWLISRSALATLGTAPFMIGSASLLTRHGGGLIWIATGILGAILGAAYGAWIVLIEILR